MRALATFALALTLLAAAAAPAPAQLIGMANPASVHCQEQGGVLEIRTGADGGQVGFCLFPDGSECEEWALYRGACRPTGQALPTPTLAGALAPEAEIGEILAQIHSAAPPPALKTVDALEELARYEEAYRKSGAQRPILELAFQHLKKHAPPPMAPVLLHGDFRNGNLMIDPDQGVVAVLDWELSHCGDPAEDLGWICVNSWRFGRADRPVGGFGDYQDLLDGYRAAGGADIPLSRLRYWQALGSLKWGVMCLMMYASYASGAESSVERPMIGRRVSETEIDLVTLLEKGL